MSVVRRICPQLSLCVCCERGLKWADVGIEGQFLKVSHLAMVEKYWMVDTIKTFQHHIIIGMQGFSKEIKLS